MAWNTDQLLRQRLEEGRQEWALCTSVDVLLEEAGLTWIGDSSLKPALDLNWGEPVGRIYKFGDRAKPNKTPQRPLTQASLRAHRWWKLVSYQRIPTPGAVTASRVRTPRAPQVPEAEVTARECVIERRPFEPKGPAHRRFAHAVLYGGDNAGPLFVMNRAGVAAVRPHSSTPWPRKGSVG